MSRYTLYQASSPLPAKFLDSLHVHFINRSWMYCQTTVMNNARTRAIPSFIRQIQGNLILAHQMPIKLLPLFLTTLTAITLPKNCARTLSTHFAPPGSVYPVHITNKPPQNTKVHTAQQMAAPNAESAFTLDSIAHPTHIRDPRPSLPHSQYPSTRTAANQTTTCTCSGVLTILISQQHPPQRGQCVTIPRLHSNLLSVHDTAAQYCAVLFRTQHDYIINFQYHPKPLVEREPHGIDIDILSVLYLQCAKLA